MAPQDHPEHPSLTRRQMLAASGVAFAVGAAGTEAANLAFRSSGSPTASAIPPDVDLMEEHGVLKRVLLVYQEASRRIAAGQSTPLAEIHQGALIIHDFIEGFHEALEEGYIFPQLTHAGVLVSTVDTLYVQHARGRTITQYLLAQSAKTGADGNPDAIGDALDAFVRMYQPHEAREDTVVFPTYRAMRTADQLNELGTTFSELAKRQFGREGFTDFVKQVAAIEMSLGIYDLDQFTAAPLSSSS
jgi:hemerythrin-like domain-containing protein